MEKRRKTLNRFASLHIKRENRFVNCQKNACLAGYTRMSKIFNVYVNFLIDYCKKVCYSINLKKWLISMKHFTAFPLCGKGDRLRWMRWKNCFLLYIEAIHHTNRLWWMRWRKMNANADSRGRLSLQHLISQLTLTTSRSVRSLEKGGTFFPH